MFSIKFSIFLCYFFGYIHLNYLLAETPPKTIITNKLTTPLNLAKFLVWGPGLRPESIITPARYFYIHAVDDNGQRINESLPLPYEIEIKGSSRFGEKICRSTINQINRGDGSVIVRYKIVDKCSNMEIHIKYDGGKYVAQSPYQIPYEIRADDCNCPLNIDYWLEINECPPDEQQIDEDLRPFRSVGVNFTHIREKILQKFNSPGSVSLCNYIIKNNEIFRECFGQYTGFKMFMDAILISLVRKVTIPDTEFFINLGDWPLVKKHGHSRTTGPYPIFSWCGSDDTFDIVLPTYDITESTLENMRRVLLDMLSVQRADKLWHEKETKAFWRGRDSRRERLNLIDLGRSHPELFNVSLTNFFFYRDEESRYGPKSPTISFMEFFNYKYQINIDGTVAAYRFPYLLAGNSLVFKQDSPFYEHFYKKLQPDVHYVEFKRDLSDLVDKIKWAINNENKVLNIIKNAQEFTRQHLMPQHIFCYHVHLLKKWTDLLVDEIRIQPNMDRVPIPKNDCDCSVYKEAIIIKDEL